MACTLDNPGLTRVFRFGGRASFCGFGLHCTFVLIFFRPSSPGICRRFLSVAFRFTISLVILVVIVFVGLAVMDRHTSFKTDTYFPLSKVRKVLEPFGELIYYIKPPE